jgi:hypothetical protein
MAEFNFTTRKKIGCIIVLASLVSLVAIYFYTGHIAEERVAEFNRRDPEFMERNWALKETGPRNRLGLEVTASVGLVEIKARGPGEPEPTPYQGSAVFKSVSTGQIWEVVVGKAQLLWSPNPLWLVTTHPVPVSIALVSCIIGLYLVLSKVRR